MLATICYLISSIFFILGIKQLSSPKTAMRGNLISAVGMLIAVITVLVTQEILTYQWIIAGLIIGTLIGTIMARLVEMTQMPEMVGLLNGFGGIASALVGWSEYHETWATLSNGHLLFAIYLTLVIGIITFSGSLVIYGKLSGLINSKAMLFPMQHAINFLLLASAFIVAGLHITGQFSFELAYQMLLVVSFIAFIYGLMLVLPIGGADMPVVIALLNSCSGLAACFAGFVINNIALVVVGALVGASGLILTTIMCKAMNRSLSKVLFSGFGATQQRHTGEDLGEPNPVSVNDAYLMLEAAKNVLIVPGYGMAVAQAQHVVREFSDALTENGAEVRFAIHPVAGRMPGHMNVLLAEANVPYDQLTVPDEVNPLMETYDVCIVLGANDVVNPAAKEDENSPIYGMPIIEVTRSKIIIVCKRSMASGFSGLVNKLFYLTNTRMLFGDAKESIASLVAEFKES